jgi:SSS family solute:Na+ symporter
VELETRPVARARHRFDLSRFIGINEEFTRGDRWLTFGRFAWTMAWFTLFVVGTTVQLFFHHFTNRTWANFWLWANIWVNLPLGVIATIWFTIGCTHDMRAFFKRLRMERVDVQDDGTVEGDPNHPRAAPLDELAVTDPGDQETELTSVTHK